VVAVARWTRVVWDISCLLLGSVCTWSFCDPLRPTPWIPRLRSLSPGRVGAPSMPRPGPTRRSSAVRAHTTQTRAKEHHVATFPSVSYSITVRLELDAGGTAVGSLTNAVEQVGR